MSDQQQHQAPEQDSPDHEGEQTPEFNWETDDNPFVGRFRETQSWGTRQAQENAELRRALDGIRAMDPDTLRDYGLDVVADEEPALSDDPVLARLEAIERAQQQVQASLSQRDEQAQQAQQLSELQQHVEAQLGAIDGLPTEDRDWVIHRALNSPTTDDGMPDIQGAYQALKARDEAAQRRWAETKRTQRVSPVGQPGSPAPDLTDEQQRQARMREHMASFDD